MYEKELRVAIQAVKKAEKTFHRYFGTKTAVRKKNGDFRNLASFADRKIEEDLKKFLLEKFPSLGFLGEESGAVRAQAKFKWVLDPVDGTSNYLHGLPDCAIALALLKDNRPVLGVISAPILKKIYTAVLGQGAKLNGQQITVSKTKELKKAFAAFGWAKDRAFAARYFSKVIKQIFNARVAGSVSLALCQVADGSFDLFFGKKTENVWDYAPGQIILLEAGGVFQASGKKNILLAANKKMLKDAQGLLKQT